MTVPGFLNFGHSAFGSEHAVTVGNVMIFSHMPDLGNEVDMIWLLHELRHIEQYMRYSPSPLESIDGFATDYVQRSNGMGSDAENTARSWHSLLLRFYSFR